jgi:hypothetical protein
MADDGDATFVLSSTRYQHHTFVISMRRDVGAIVIPVQN